MFGLAHYGTKNAILSVGRRFLTSASQLIASAITVRIPVILPEPTPFEKAHHMYTTELIYARTKRFIDLQTQQHKKTEAEYDAEAEELLEQSPPASRKPRPEIDRDLPSVHRRLDTYLYFIVRQADQWHFPRSEHTLKDHPLHQVNDRRREG
jgi:hypothetical protein